MTRILRFLPLIACAGLLHAQQSSGQTDMFYDDGQNLVYAVTSVDADYYTQYYYTVEMQTYITKLGYWLGTWESFGYWSTDYGSGGAVAVAPGEPGVELTAISYYYGVTRYMTYEVVYGCWDCYDWYDAYGYSLIAGTGGPWEGPTFSVWVWAAPLIIARILEETTDLGDGGAKFRPPGAPQDFDVQVRSFIPAPWVDSVFAVDSCGINPLHQVIYNGNNRGFARGTNYNVKTHSNLFLRPDAGGQAPGSYVYHYTGHTERYEKATGLAPDGITLLRDPVLHDCYKLDDSGFAPTGNLHADVSGNAGARLASAHFYGGAANPLVFGAPEISWDISVSISNPTPPLLPSYTISYTHDCFPAFEVYIGSQGIHQSSPAGYDPVSDISYCLLGFGQISGLVSGTVTQ